MKKNIIVALFSLVAMMSMTSCGTLSGVAGSGTLGGIISDVIVGQTVGHNTPAGRVAANVAGRWRDGSSVITTTGKPGYYNVMNTKSGEIDTYYLMPFTKAMQTKPNCGPVISYQPICRNEGMRWYVKTAGGEYHVFAGGGWCRI